MIVAGRAAPAVVGDAPGTRQDRFGKLLEALDSLRENDVYITNGGQTPYSLWGELMSTRAQRLKAVGCVLNGYCRDEAGILDLGFPTFCWGSYALDISFRGKVLSYGAPTTVGDVPVSPGDIVFGDRDGVFVLLSLTPRASIAQFYGSGKETPNYEAAQADKLKNIGIDQKLDAQVPLDLTLPAPWQDSDQLRPVRHAEPPPQLHPRRGGPDQACKRVSQVVRRNAVFFKKILLKREDTQQPVDVARVEETPLAARVGDQQVAGEPGEVAPEPMRQRHGKAVLGPVDDVVRKHAAHRTLEQILRRAVAQAEARRNRGRELHQPVIEERRPRLEGMRHRHPIDLGENVERKVRVEIAVLHRGQLIDCPS